MMLSTTLLRLSVPAKPANRARLRRFMEGITLWLAFLLLLFVQPLYAEANVADELQPGLLHFTDNRGDWQEPALVLDSDFDVTVSGLIADTRLTRHFRNTSDHWREGVFVFPLPEKASVYALTMTVGERTITGEVRPKAQAREEYAEARDSGRQAATVEQQRPNLFTSRVANIPPGEDISIELRYQQPVDYRDGQFSLRLPTTLTPRYMPGPMLPTGEAAGWSEGWAIATREVPDADAISPFTVRPEDVAADSHRASISVSLSAGLELADVTSPGHELETRTDGQEVHVSPSEGTVLMNRDFVLRWRPVHGSEPVAAVFHEQFDGEDYLMTMVVPGAASDLTLPRDLVFVIDTSGSMAGESIRQARQALGRGLDTLSAEDRFNVIQFNSQPHALFMAPVPADGMNLARAHRYVSRLQAEGGTEMASALSLALGGAGSDDTDDAARVRQVVFITDGAVGNEAGLFRQIREQLGNQRLFTVGIGSAPNMHFMREAARWGRGTYTAVSNTADLGGPLVALFSAMEAPVLTGLRTQWPVADAEAFPERPGDLLRGEPLIQVVRGVPPEGTLSVTGMAPDGKRWKRTLDLRQSAGGTGLHRRWARAKIDSLLDRARIQGEQPDEEQIVRLAMAHSLMSPFTSFLAVDSKPVRSGNDPLLADSVPTLLPAGTSAGMLRYPQTATISPLLIALGLVGMMFSAAIVLLRGRVGL
ncbi:Ca-activated chloride channel family protein [Marinobacter pelagius]|uniref:Ca-activated chloride channel family protein n=1 Tax=Marinobacter pelagius TaxID=379482 RepID=A0A366G990_9GAMM|nr:marine proteobacterial sortase target protein [Marinobacter pelagius]RBP23484.1 Ca-activated chloride channel family protein [Marinobacter pelagius]